MSAGKGPLERVEPLACGWQGAGMADQTTTTTDPRENPSICAFFEAMHSIERKQDSLNAINNPAEGAVQDIEAEIDKTEDPDKAAPLLKKLAAAKTLSEATSRTNENKRRRLQGEIAEEKGRIDSLRSSAIHAYLETVLPAIHAVSFDPLARVLAATVDGYSLAVWQAADNTSREAGERFAGQNTVQYHRHGMKLGLLGRELRAGAEANPQIRLENAVGTFTAIFAEYDAVFPKIERMVAACHAFLEILHPAEATDPAA